MDKKLLRIISFARPYRSFVPKYILFIIPATIFGILNFALIKPVLDVVFESRGNVKAIPLPDFNTAVHSASTLIQYLIDSFHYLLYYASSTWGVKGTLLCVCISLLVATFLANLFKYLAGRTLLGMNAYVNMNLRNALFNKILRLDVGYFNQKRKGDLMSSLTNDVSEIQVSVVNSFQVVIREPLMIIGYLLALFYISYQLTIISLIAIPLSGYIIGRISKRLRQDAGFAQSFLGSLISIIEETISGVRIIKGFGAQDYTNNRFRKTNDDYRRAVKKVYYRQELASPLSEFFGVVIILGILYFGGLLILGGSLAMDTTTFITYLALYFGILNPAKELTKSYANIQRGIASAERVFAILDQPLKIEDAPEPVNIKSFEKEIEFKNVCFKYTAEGTEVIHDLSLTIPKGQMYALVGHSGAGKTTIADLIPRFYDVESGSISIDGTNIKDISTKSLINLMGIVNQESILFNDSIFNNITFGMDATEEEVIKAAEIANAHEFIAKMPEGYQTNIGDRGGRLSGGQRQRIAIARAVLKNPEILILDEATSALDTESEKLVQQALSNIMKNRTSVVIAHRLSTIQHANKIIVLDQGRIIEEGTHTELIEQKGTYFNLCQIQSFK